MVGEVLIKNHFAQIVWRIKQLWINVYILAEQIADELMTNVNGDKANRLVLELSNGHDGGGLIYSSIVRIVYEKLCNTDQTFCW